MAAGTASLAAAAGLLVLFAQASPVRAQIHDLTEVPPPPLTDDAADTAFQCPESLPGEDQRRQALIDYFHWAEVRHPDWSVADAVEFKKRLLVRHRCTVSLRDMADYAKHEQLPPRQK